MGHQLRLLLLLSLIVAINAQYPFLMQMPITQRPNQIMQFLSRPRWPLLGYKPQFMNINGPSILNGFRAQKPLIVLPTTQNLIWKQPINFRPNPKDIYQTRPTLVHAAISNYPVAGIPASFITSSSNQSPLQQPLVATKVAPVNLLSPSYTKVFSQKPHSVQPAQTVNYAVSTTPTTHNAVTRPSVSFRTEPPKPTTKPTISFSQHILNNFPTSQPLPLTYSIMDGNHFDKSPIHTIPAPNLSLFSKPIIVPDQTNNIDFQSSSTHNKAKRTHSYEVTEDTKDDSYKQNSYTHNLNNQISQANNKVTTVVKNNLPQASALQAQAHIPLSSQDLFKLLSTSPSQQQLSDTYTLPLSQQPQLQQHFLRNSYRKDIPVKSDNAAANPAVQATSHINVQQNVLYNPEQRYAANAPNEYYKYFNFQPNYQTFNYVEPQNPQAAQSVEHAQVQKAEQQSDQAKSHVTRNTQEGVINHVSDVFNATNRVDNSIAGSKDSEFIPIEPKFYHGDLFKDDLAVSSTDKKNYFSSLSSNVMADTIATLQAAGNLMNIAKISNPGAKNAVNLNPYTLKNSIPYVEQNSAFTPSPAGYRNRLAPIRIYIPDQYDDIETQPSKNIEVKASLNAEVSSNNNDDYYYRYMEEFDNNTATEPTPDIYVTPVQDMGADDVIVSVNKNISAPTLDILTKDWKTSIVIKPKPEDNVKNHISEFGSKIRSKRV